MMIGRRFITLSLALATFLVSVPGLCSHAQAGSSEADTALANLITRLAGGPLRVQPAPRAAAPVSEKAATKAAGRSVGIDTAPAHAWPVVVTDQEFRGDLLKEKRCWLLEYPNALALPIGQGQTRRHLTLYVAVDARTGQCWEAFTAPEARWWERVKLRDKALLAQYLQSGEEVTSARALPHFPLLRILNATNSAILDYGYQAQQNAQQIIARHFVYTTPVDTQVRTEHGIRRLRSHDREPVWSVSFQGVHLPPLPGPPTQSEALSAHDLHPTPAARPDTEEINLLLNATQGRLFETSSFR